jgi:glutathione S-transferase
MADYVEIEQARQMSGLRLVLLAGVPSPWGEAAKGIFRVKRIPFARVRHELGGPNAALREWTGQTSLPVAIWNDERPRTTWVEQLLLAERLGPEPALIPADPEQRALMLGLSHEICGEMGLGWCMRLIALHPGLQSADAGGQEFLQSLAWKYGYTPAAAEAAPPRVAQILRMLHARLTEQRSRGHRFFMGDRPTAVDIYWAAFAAMMLPLPHDLCPMPEALRQTYTNTNPVVRAAATPELFAHRDHVYREYLELPIDL